jgi:acetyl esterase/lipase
MAAIGSAIRELFAMLVEGMAAHGWSGAFPGYSLAPEATVADIVQEISLALDWLAANGPSRGIASPVVLTGGPPVRISPRSRSIAGRGRACGIRSL